MVLHASLMLFFPTRTGIMHIAGNLWLTCQLSIEDTVLSNAGPSKNRKS